MSTSDLITRYVRTLVKTADQSDWGAQDICDRAGLKVSEVLSEPGNDGPQCSAEQLAVVVQELFRRDEYMGQIPDAPRKGSFALMCEISLLSDTLGEALERAFRYYRVLTDIFSVELHEQGERAVIEIYLAAIDADQGNLMKEWWPRMWHRLAGWLIGENIPLHGVSFTHAAMAADVDYEAVFNCPCEFEQATSQLVFDAKWLARPISRDLSDLDDYLGFSRLDLVTLPGDESSLKRRIEAALHKYFVANHQFPPIERIASECCVSSQTLRRRLQDEDSSYTQIKESIKREVVTAYLQDLNLPFSEVSRLGGFAEPSGLTRAVKAWHGASPRVYRQRFLEARDHAGGQY